MADINRSAELLPFVRSELSHQTVYNIKGKILALGPFIWRLGQNLFTPYTERTISGQRYLVPSINPDDFFRKSSADLENSATFIKNIAGRSSGEVAPHLHILGIFLHSLAKVAEQGPSECAEPDFVLRERVARLFSDTNEPDTSKWKSGFEKVSDAYAASLALKRPAGFTEAVSFFTDAISERNMELSKTPLEGLTPLVIERNAANSAFGYLVHNFNVTARRMIR